MIELKTLESLATRITALLPADAAVVRNEIRDNVRALLEAALARMDLVTREDFEAQGHTLRRTREKLEALERRLAELERGRSD